MGVYASGASQPAGGDAIFTDIRNDDSLMISHNNIGYLTLTVYEKAYLATDFVGKPADIASKFECNKELGWKAAAVKISKFADMACFKPADIPEKFFHIN